MMQTSDSDRAARTNRRKVQSSTTLSRKYTKRPTKSADVMVAVKRSPKIQRFSPTMAPVVQAQKPVAEDSPTAVVAPHPIQDAANAKLRTRAAMAETPQRPKVSAKELKDQAIQKALASASNISEGVSEMSEGKKTKTKGEKISDRVYFGFGKILLALSCAAVAVFAIVYFVNLNMPDISLRVAAMQTGIDPTYPNYVPRDYNVSSITSEEGKITIKFDNNSTGGSFALTEEKSSWDTNALVSNFVKDEYGENYSIVREQGLTIYISGSNAAWVNGGIMYKIDTFSGDLTNKQIRAIATSL
ncbi:MAG: hypothetical protein Q4F56_00615 [Candidatus Saccharibacteria bacterium]|nr:hypothetical protein [Candidatus Saccharibacteria bacterium]